MGSALPDPGSSLTCLMNRKACRLETKISPPGMDKGGCGGRKKKKYGKPESRRIGTEVEAGALVGGPAHASALQSPGWPPENRSPANATRQRHPTAKQRHQKKHAAPEKNEEQKESQRIFVQDILRGPPSSRCLRRPSGRQGKPPAGYRRGRCASFVFCPPSAFRGACVCAKCRRRSIWRERFCAWRRRFRGR
jgi:hypothetical protein